MSIGRASLALLELRRSDIEVALLRSASRVGKGSIDIARLRRAARTFRCADAQSASAHQAAKAPEAAKAAKGGAQLQGFKTAGVDNRGDAENADYNSLTLGSPPWLLLHVSASPRRDCESLATLFGFRCAAKSQAGNIR